MLEMKFRIERLKTLVMVVRELKIRMTIFMIQHDFHKLKRFHAKSSTNSFAGLKEM